MSEIILELENGSRIVSLPGTEETIVGYNDELLVRMQNLLAYGTYSPDCADHAERAGDGADGDSGNGV